ncbi:MAG: FtsQ-type POTRA domain-containing protein, partial [Verrucomicrobia bacterium]|nr:FtsQ-type POTRA domain-containing protein [Verrucomicrobiota bacterium]
RKPKNRRLGRDQVLDVRLRSSQVRAARTRMTALSLGAVFVTVFGIYLFYRGSDWALNRLVYENKAFAIQEIDVQTDGVISLDQLRRWAGVKPEENLLALDLMRVKRDLEMIPLVKTVSVERILPRTLRIRITEREPVAQVSEPRPRSAGGIELSVYHLDAEGWVMLPLDPRARATPLNQSPDSLPEIRGINPNALQPGRRLVVPQLQAALQLLAAFDQSPMSGLVELRRVDLSSPEVLAVTTGQGSEVTFGLTDFEQQLRIWHTVFELGQKAGSAVATLDLAVTNNIPLRWLEASAVLPAAPKSPKPLRPKKKHV